MANNTMKSLLDFAKSSGRLVVETWGDSTCARDGYGHSASIFRALCDFTYGVGVLVPANALGSLDNNTLGLYKARRTTNMGTVVGVSSAIGSGVSGYPNASKTVGYSYSPTNGWICPAPAYLAKATLSAALGTGGAGTTFDATSASDAASFPGEGVGVPFDIRIDNEVLRVHRTGTQFTVVSRARFPGSNGLDAAATSHVINSTILYADNGAQMACEIENQHPIALSSGLAAVIAYMPLNASSLSNGTYYGKNTYYTYNQYVQNVAGRYDALADDNTAFTPNNFAWNPDSLAVNTLILREHAMSRVDRASWNMIGPISAATSGGAWLNGYGPYGPAVVFASGYIATARPYGVIQAMGVYQGGFRLAQCLNDLRVYDTTVGTIEYDNHLKVRYQIAEKLGNATGGNGVFGYAFFNAWGHNETADATGYSGFPIAGQDWSVFTTKTLGADIASGTAMTGAGTITLNNTTGLYSTGGILRIGSEYFRYTSILNGTTIQGVTRAVFGTQAGNHSTGATVSFGYKTYHPNGFASCLYYDFTIKRDLWTSLGYPASRFFYVWFRPIPTTASETVISDDSPITTEAQRMYKQARFVAAAQAFCASNLDGFIVADLSQVFTGAEDVNYKYGVTDADLVHSTKAASDIAWQRYLAQAAYGSLSGTITPATTRPRLPSGSRKWWS